MQPDDAVVGREGYSVDGFGDTGGGPILAGLGDYPEIHWQVRALGNPCSRMPGPLDWAYQGVVKLRPEDAHKLTQRYEFMP